MKREPRGAAFPELRASCVPELRASVPALKFRKNFDKHFKIFESSYPHPTFDQRSGAWLKLRGEDGYVMRQVPRSSTKTRQRKSQNWSREKWRFEDRKGSTPNLEEIWVYRRRFLSKKGNLTKKHFIDSEGTFPTQKGLFARKAAAPPERAFGLKLRR